MQSVEGDFQKRAPLVFIDQVDKSGEGVLHLLGIAQALGNEYLSAMSN